jgi:hypothetical protein
MRIATLEMTIALPEVKAVEAILEQMKIPVKVETTKIAAKIPIVSVFVIPHICLKIQFTSCISD